MTNELRNDVLPYSRSEVPRNLIPVDSEDRADPPYLKRFSILALS